MRKLLFVFVVTACSVGAHAVTDTIAGFKFAGPTITQRGNSTDNPTEVVTKGNCYVRWQCDSTGAKYTLTKDEETFYCYSLAWNNSIAAISIRLQDGDSKFREGDTITVYAATAKVTNPTNSGLYLGSMSGTKIETYMRSAATLYAIKHVLTAEEISNFSLVDSLGFWRLKEVRLAAIYITREGTASSSETISRTISGGYASFSSASNVTLPDGVTAYTGELSTGDNGTNVVKLTKYAEAGSIIPGNNGYILAGSDGDISLTKTEGTAIDAPTSNGLVSTGDEGKTVSDNEYYGLNSSGTFVKINAGTVPANRAIIAVSSTTQSSVSMVIVDDNEFVDNNETTGIDNAIASKKKDDNIYYNLQGMRVSNPAAGIYILNGKKIIIK